MHGAEALVIVRQAFDAGCAAFLDAVLVYDSNPNPYPNPNPDPNPDY